MNRLRHWPRSASAAPLYVVLGVVLGGLPGCSDRVNSPSTPPVPVVQGLVVLGQPRHSLRVEWSTPADSPYTGVGSPVEASEVNLALTLPDGHSIPFVAAPGAPGRFDAETTVEAGGLYRLSGTVAERTVSAEVRVPTALTILVPTSDPIQIPVASCVITCSVPFHWKADGAVAYDYSQYSLDGRESLMRAAARDTMGILALRSEVDTTVLRVLAYDDGAANFLLSRDPIGNVQGTSGFLGAAALTERLIVIE